MPVTDETASKGQKGAGASAYRDFNCESECSPAHALTAPEGALWIGNRLDRLMVHPQKCPRHFQYLREPTSDRGTRTWNRHFRPRVISILDFCNDRADRDHPDSALLPPQARTSESLLLPQKAWGP